MFCGDLVIVFSNFLQELARITGARAYTHKTGPTIMKVFQTQRQAYDNTEVRVYILTLCILMDFSIWFDTIHFG